MSRHMTGKIIITSTKIHPFKPFGASCATATFEMVRR